MKPHYLEPIKTDKLPALHVVFDCETQLHRRAERSAHYWTVGGSAIVKRDPDECWRTGPAVIHRSPADLWSAITDIHRDRRKLVVWAHNLTFDLRVSEALRYLPENGYELEAIVLERTAAWASFDGPRGSLILCDLFSWLPTSLDKLAEDMGNRRREFNYSAAGYAELEHRCNRDVGLTAEVVRRMLAYLDAIGAGPFRPTGSGQSHACWRRNFLPPKAVLVHGDTHALERERAAMHTGRAEAWRWGEVDGPLYEHDLNLAYCRIAAESEVPTKLLYRSGPVASKATYYPGNNRTYLADVEVVTTHPLVPVTDGNRTYWPVGRFRTCLWKPEIDLLEREGASVHIHRSWVYETAPVLAPMAQWIIAQLDPDNESVPAPVKRMLKHWARTLVGRCGLRYRRWEDFGEVPRMGLGLSIMHDLETGLQTELLHVGEKVMELADMAESDTSVPQITGWVMSQARVNLWQLIKIAGDGNVVYIDTDGLIVNRAGHENLHDRGEFRPWGSLVHKATWASATIVGPRNITLESQRRIAGIPTHAVRVGDTTYDGEVWAGVKASLSGSQLDNVTVTKRLFEVTQGDNRRRHIAKGYTRPHEVENGFTE